MADAERRILSGTEALVELPLIQHQLDAAAGLDTAGFVTGYRGSPLGGYDQALVAAKARLEAANVRFQPGLNEDLAATAVWGTQQVGLWPGATVGGVFGIWYGKGPGVDRSLDALKHGNAAGTSAKGGVLLIAGDDHGCVSSTLPHQSGPVFAAASIPVLAPSSVSELIEYGLLGIAMSRASGCWVAMTGASEVIETTATVDLEPAPPVAVPTADVHIRWPDPPMEQERRLHQVKLPAALAFAAANRIDHVAVDHLDPALTIVATGKAYGDVRAALTLLGDVPVRVIKVGLAWPLGPWVGDWVAGDRAVLVVEEKRSFVEEQLVGQLINRTARPIITGKRDEDGAALLPSIGELNGGMVAEAIAARIGRLTGTRPSSPDHVALAAPGASLPVRAPFFCAGCPHNTSTVLPEGSRAMGGIGCHGMATWMPDRNTALLTHMGAEGATWIGQAPFTSERHIFQNMGDGTYNHSGLLAIRAAIAAGVNITYKILYNDAVAMTGGQPHDGAVTVQGIAAQVVAEGACAVAVVSEQPDRLARLPADVSLDGRDALDSVQRRLRDTPGVTVLIYDQTCAAELRRRRRTDESLRRTTHVMINPEVCEGCGDCSAVSNCIAIQPLETPLGRKRRIDPASCNQDYSCIEGFCPSFVTVETRGDPPAAAGVHEAPPVVAPPAEIASTAEIVIAGIGGTGVVTIGAILAAAAEIDGLACSVLDVTGLSQKNGAVMSQVRMGAGGLHGARIAEGSASLLIACDMIAATAVPVLSRCGAATRVVANGDVAPTAAFVREGSIDLGRDAAIGRIAERCEQPASVVDATALAERLVGGAVAANILLLGHAWQSGAIPVSQSAIGQAIAQVAPGARNRAAFDWGRAIATDPVLAGQAERPTPLDTLDAIVADRVARLTAYQNAAYADRYRRWIDRVGQVESTRVGGDRLARAVAIALYRLMAIKDEYEVARLHRDPVFATEIARRFGAGAKISYHLAAPILGERKRRYGPWMRPVFAVLASCRRLRGGPLDLFGMTRHRRQDRAVLTKFEASLADMLETLDPTSIDHAVSIVQASELVRGYGQIRDKSIEHYDARLSELNRDEKKGARAAATA